MTVQSVVATSLFSENDVSCAGNHSAEISWQADSYRTIRTLKLGAHEYQSTIGGGVERGNGTSELSQLTASAERLARWRIAALGKPPPQKWWLALLHGLVPAPQTHIQGRPIRTVDLFSAAGGLTLGAQLLASEIGSHLQPIAAVDTDRRALEVHRANHHTQHLIADSVASLVDYRIENIGRDSQFSYAPTLSGPAVRTGLDGIDLVLAGPPCQGHSNLNNHSRRSDQRNYYYLTAVAFAIAAQCRAVIIENVPGVVRDRTKVVDAAEKLLRDDGYHVETGVLRADAMGWPQTRRRHFLIARRGSEPISIQNVSDAFQVDVPLSVLDAIGEGCFDPDKIEEPTLSYETRHSLETLERIHWLFKNKKYNLPDRKRPDSHKAGHTYGASYGRMDPSKPAPTITTGFTTPGRGRFIHPTERRTITPAEAARLQGFPDTYKWRPTPDSDPPTRTQLAKWIGDAVPLPLGYAAAMSALGPDLMDNPPKAADRDAKTA